MRIQRKNSRHTRKQNLACLKFVSFQYNVCVEVIIIIKVIFDPIRLWPGGGGGGGGASVSQAQHGSQRLDQTQGLYLESLSLKN